jgi:hypothetical protein
MIKVSWTVSIISVHKTLKKLALGKSLILRLLYVGLGGALCLLAKAKSILAFSAD